MSFRARRVTLSMLMMAAVLTMLAGEGVAGAQGAGVVSGTQLVPVDNCNGAGFGFPITGDLVGCWYTDIGPLHQWVHIWPFQDAAERQRVRAEAVERKMWPPVTAEWLLRMENCLALPAAFSPLH